MTFPKLFFELYSTCAATIDTNSRPITPNANHQSTQYVPILCQCPSAGRPNVLAAVVAPSSFVPSFVGSKIFPGFISQYGSSAFLILRMTSIVGVPSSCNSEAFLPKPLQILKSASLTFEPKDKVWKVVNRRQKTVREHSSRQETSL